MAKKKKRSSGNGGKNEITQHPKSQRTKGILDFRNVYVFKIQIYDAVFEALQREVQHFKQGHIHWEEFCTTYKILEKHDIYFYLREYKFPSILVFVLLLTCLVVILAVFPLEWIMIPKIYFHILIVAGSLQARSFVTQITLRNHPPMIKFESNGCIHNCKPIVFDYMKYLFVKQKTLPIKEKKDIDKSINDILKGCLIRDELEQQNSTSAQNTGADGKEKPDSEKKKDAYEDLILKEYSEILNSLETYSVTKTYLSEKKRPLKKIFFGTVKSIIEQHKVNHPEITTVARRKCVLEAVDNVLSQVCHKDGPEKDEDCKSRMKNAKKQHGDCVAFNFLHLDDFAEFIEKADPFRPFVDTLKKEEIKEILRSERQRLVAENSSNNKTPADIANLYRKIARSVKDFKLQYTGIWYARKSQTSCIRDLIYLSPDLALTETGSIETDVKRTLKSLMKSADETLEELTKQPCDVQNKYSSSFAPKTGYYIDKNKRNYIVFNLDDNGKPSSLLAVGELATILGKTNNEQVLATYTEKSQERICDLYRLLRKHAPSKLFNVKVCLITDVNDFGRKTNRIVMTTVIGKIFFNQGS